MTQTQDPQTTTSTIDRDATKFAQIILEGLKEMERSHGIATSPRLAGQKGNPLETTIVEFDAYKMKYYGTNTPSKLSEEFLDKLRGALEKLDEKISPERWQRLDAKTHEGNNSAFHAMFDTLFGQKTITPTTKDPLILHKDAQKIADLLGEAIATGITHNCGDQQMFTHPYLELREGYNTLKTTYPGSAPSDLQEAAQTALETAVKHLFRENPELARQGEQNLSEVTQRFLANLNPCFTLSSYHWTGRVNPTIASRTNYSGIG